MDPQEFRTTGHYLIDLLARINPVNFRTRREHMDQLLQLLETEC